VIRAHQRYPKQLVFFGQKYKFLLASICVSVFSSSSTTAAVEEEAVYDVMNLMTMGVNK